MNTGNDLQTKIMIRAEPELEKTESQARFKASEALRQAERPRLRPLTKRRVLVKYKISREKLVQIIMMIAQAKELEYACVCTISVILYART